MIQINVKYCRGTAVIKPADLHFGNILEERCLVAAQELSSMIRKMMESLHLSIAQQDLYQWHLTRKCYVPV